MKKINTLNFIATLLKYIGIAAAITGLIILSKKVVIIDEYIGVIEIIAGSALTWVSLKIQDHVNRLKLEFLIKNAKEVKFFIKNEDKEKIFNENIEDKSKK